MTDLHTETASVLYGVPSSKVTPAMRRTAKTINFKKLYGVKGDVVVSKGGFMFRLRLGDIELAEMRESTPGDPMEGYYARFLNEGWRWMGSTEDAAKVRVLDRLPEGVLPFVTWLEP